MPERHCEPHRQHRTGQCAGRASRGDEAEQPLALLAREQVGHEGPEHRNREQVEDADPDEEHACDLDLGDIQAEQQPEDRDVGDEEVVDERDEPPPRQPRHHGAEQRHRGQHRDEGRGEQPLQVAHPARDAHLVAQRPQHVVAGEQAEEVGERPEQCPRLARAHLDRAAEPALQIGFGHGTPHSRYRSNAERIREDFGLPMSPDFGKLRSCNFPKSGDGLKAKRAHPLRSGHPRQASAERHATR